MKVYVDDMLTKSPSIEQLLLDLQEIFNVLRLYNMKLSPEKCTFEVGAGKFLGFLISE